MPDASTLSELPADPRPAVTKKTVRVSGDRRRGDAYMATVLANVGAAQPGGRNDALNHAAWTLGRWIAAGALEQGAVEDELYSAAEVNGVVADDGEHQCWATIRSGLSAGLQEPIDLEVRH